MPHLDHLILNVNHRAESLDFYTSVMGFKHQGERDPFSLIRVSDDLVIQLAPFGTSGGTHLAFEMTRAEFEQVFKRARDASIEYGDRFDAVGNMRGPGPADGANGSWQAVYFFDPNRHLIEIAYYERWRA